MSNASLHAPHPPLAKAREGERWGEFTQQVPGPPQSGVQRWIRRGVRFAHAQKLRPQTLRDLVLETGGEADTRGFSYGSLCKEEPPDGSPLSQQRWKGLPGVQGERPALGQLPPGLRPHPRPSGASAALP